jgi:hypothetical protein
METLSDELCQTQAFILRALARAGLSIVDAKDRAVLDACAELSTDNLETFGKPIGFGTKWQRFAWAELARREVKP